MRFHGCMSAIQMEPRRHTATHSLDGISWLHVSNSNGAQEVQQLTAWMGFHSCMSAIQIEPRRHTATHSLNGILWLHVSNSNRVQETHSNSLPEWDFMAACQQFKWSPGGTQQLTDWMEFHGCLLAVQMEPRRHSNSQTGWDFMAACQQFK